MLEFLGENMGIHVGSHNWSCVCVSVTGVHHFEAVVTAAVGNRRESPRADVPSVSWKSRCHHSSLCAKQHSCLMLLEQSLYHVFLQPFYFSSKSGYILECVV